MSVGTAQTGRTALPLKNLKAKTMKKYILIAALAASTLSLVSSVTAGPRAPNAGNNSDGTVTVGSLKKKGFKCGKVTVGFHECRKGNTVYYCDGSSSSSSCSLVPKVSTKPLRPTAPVQGPVFILR